MQTGKFICLEGIEGAGKSTVIRELAEHLRSLGREVEVTREPGGTELAEAIRAVLLAEHSAPVPPDCELLLMFAARAAHLAQRIRPALAAGRWVLCDRFVDASRAYQGAGRGMDRAWIESLAGRVVDQTLPDRVVVLDLPVEQGFARAARRGALNRFDREDQAFMNRVRDAYLGLVAQDPERYRCVDATGDIPAVIRGALKAIEDLV